MKNITVIDAKYKNNKTKNKSNDDGYLVLRYWQNGTYHYMKDSWYNTIVAPTGSGKTVAIETLIWNFLKTNSGYKTIITVPQNSIGLGYGNNKFIVGKEKVSITIPKRNFRIHSLGNVERIKDFLKEEVDDEDINSRILVCTHASLVKLCKKLSPTKFKKLFKKCQLWVDESHHIRTTIVENDYEFNRLSEVIHSFIQNDYSVGIVTATFFRGDGHGFLKEEYKKKFLSYRHTYEDYFNYDCKTLKGVKLHIALYENNIYEAVYDIYKKNQVPTIIYLPYVNSTMCGRDCKATRVKKLTKILKTINKDIKIVDLVNPKTQKENSKYINEQNKIAKKFLSGESKEKPVIDVIIALNIFKEGSDYLPLENVIIMGKHNSTVEVMQRTGRSLRDYTGKKEANVYAILPGYSRKITNEKEVQNIINENFKFFNLVMTLNDIFYPSIKEIRNKKIDPELRGRLYNTVWEKYFGETYRDIKKGILDDIPYVVSEVLSPREQWEELERHCSRLLEEKGVHNKEDRIKMFQTLQANFFVVNLLFDSSRKFEKISLDLIDKISPHDNYLLFTSKAFNIRTVAEFKKNVMDSSIYIEDLNIAKIYAPLLAKALDMKYIKDYDPFRKKIDSNKINQYEERKKLDKIIKRAIIH